MAEIQLIEKEGALEKIAQIIKAYDLMPDDVLQIFPDHQNNSPGTRPLPKARPYDPFFDCN